MTQLVTITEEGGIGTIVLNNPPVNALSHLLRLELTQVLAEALANPAIRAIVLCCEGRTFVAGADIKEFGKPPLAPDVPELVESFDAAHKPIVAALHGTALGGGLELALACSYRVAHADARLGFPEVTLGIIPGAGGTQRLPRLIGVPAALDMVVGGAPVSAARASELGLVDAVVQGDVRAEAQAFAARALADGLSVKRTSELYVPPADPEQLAELERAIHARSRGRLAPLHCVRAIRLAAELPFGEGLKRERELFLELMASSQARAQRHVFFGERELGRVPGLPEGTRPREVRSAAVVGAGDMGVRLALGFADAGLPVVLLDKSPENLERAMGSARAHYARAVEAKRLSTATAAERMGRLCPTLDYGELRAADIVVEAVTEDLAVKQAAFAAIGEACKPGAIAATTTRFLDVDRIAESARHPENVVGLHFEAPALDARLVEVARARHTAQEVWAAALKLGKTLGKVTVPVVAAPGAVGARMLGQLLGEACLLLEEGALPEQVDGALVEFGFAAGPFAELDRRGLDVAVHQRKLDRSPPGPRERACGALFESLCAGGRLGCKAGGGFYEYVGDGRRLPAPEVEALLARQAATRGIVPRAVADGEIVERCLCALINAGALLVEAGVALRPSDVDIVWVRAYGFPSYRGGPLFYADELGLAHVQRTIIELERRFGAEDWTPAPLIERLVAEGGRFHTRAV